jgi:SLT domain-containing protein
MFGAHNARGNHSHSSQHDLLTGSRVARRDAARIPQAARREAVILDEGERNTMKKQLTASTIDTQTALALPKREMLGLVTVVITNLLNNLSVDVSVQNNQVAVQVCAAVNAINTIISETLTCAIRQK